LRILVVGAGGFVGGALVAGLEEHGHDVTGTSRSGGGGLREDGPREGGLVKLDLERPDRAKALIARTEPQSIVSLAGPASVAACWQQPELAFRGNTATTATLLEAITSAAPQAHLVLASSAAVYGRPASIDQAPFTEQDPLVPASPYAASKAAAEILVAESERRTGLKASVLRLFNQIGPGQPDSQAPSEFAREIAAAEQRGDRSVVIEIGNPRARRDYTDVRDTAAAVRLIIENDVTGRINVCSGRPTGLSEIATGLAGLAKTAVEVVEKLERAHPQDIDLAAGDPSKLKAATGWKPGVPLEKSLGDLLEYWRIRMAA
jgi:GDP-4-dehydro-6-deoxy-D-mannose reductase